MSPNAKARWFGVPVALAFSLLFAILLLARNPILVGRILEKGMALSGGLDAIAQTTGFVDSGQVLGGAESMDVVLGDVDGDDDLDAVVANGFFGDPQPNQVWLNDGKATFSPGVAFGLADSLGVDLGDLDGDGDLDAFIANDGANKVWINQGGIQGGIQGAFLDSGLSLGTANSRAVALAYLNGDKKLDAVVANLGSGQVWLGGGDNSFEAGQKLGSNQNSGVAVADLDGDGDNDVVFAEGQLGDKNQVWWNDGSAVFATGQIMDTGALAQAVGVTDLDLDGQLDLIFATSGDEAIWWNEGKQKFTAGPSLWGMNLTVVVIGSL